MIRRLTRYILRPLDRYVFAEFTKIFVTAALGFPLLVTIIDLTDNLDRYLDRSLSRSAIALSYVYWIPDNMSMVLPAATLFATVFTIGALTRHSELTAAKASGISFHRMALPIFVGAVLAGGLTLFMSEVAPTTNKRRGELLQEKRHTSGTDRFNFAHAAEYGRVYKIGTLLSLQGSMTAIEIERKGRPNDPTYPTYVIASDDGFYNSTRGWVLRAGTMHVIPGETTDVTFQFDSLYDRQLTETPQQLMASESAPQEMGYEELGRYIAAHERSGGDANELRVERTLKLAIPVTCVIIAFFGAPLATSTQRGGAAYGIAVSLATTIVFLVMIQLTKAVGSKGVIQPELAAWIPNMLFGVAGLILLARTRT